MVQAGAVKSFNPLDIEQIAVGDHAGDGAGAAHAADDVVEIGVGERLAARDADHGGSQASQVVDAPVHFLERHRRRNLVVLVAVGAGEVAEPHGTICARTGWPVEASARPTIANSRALRAAAIMRPRSVDLRGVAILSIESQTESEWRIMLVPRGAERQFALTPILAP